jgi:hypothetical protein
MFELNRSKPYQVLMENYDLVASPECHRSEPCWNDLPITIAEHAEAELFWALDIAHSLTHPLCSDMELP